MSDYGSIFLRYDLVDETNGRHYKGIMGSLFRYYAPDGLIIRAVYGALSFLTHRQTVQSIRPDMTESAPDYQKLLRTFHVDFLRRSLDVGSDVVADIKKDFRNHEFEKDQLNEMFFWVDSAYAQIVFDVTGSLTGDFSIRHAIVNNLDWVSRHTNTDKLEILNAVEFTEKYWGAFYFPSSDSVEEFRKLLDTFNDIAEFMCYEDIDKYVHDPVTDYFCLE